MMNYPVTLRVNILSNRIQSLTTLYMKTVVCCFHIVCVEIHIQYCRRILPMFTLYVAKQKDLTRHFLLTAFWITLSNFSSFPTRFRIVLNLQCCQLTDGSRGFPLVIHCIYRFPLIYFFQRSIGIGQWCWRGSVKLSPTKNHCLRFLKFYAMDAALSSVEVHKLQFQCLNQKSVGQRVNVGDRHVLHVLLLLKSVVSCVQWLKNNRSPLPLQSYCSQE